VLARPARLDGVDARRTDHVDAPHRISGCRIERVRLPRLWEGRCAEALKNGSSGGRGSASGGTVRRSSDTRSLTRMLAHGSRLLGLVRAGAFTLYGNTRSGKSGTDQVYGLNMARFLADNDRPDQLVLSLYGQLAAGLTPGTHVAGEAATVAPIAGEYHRRMFLPPNSGGNSTLLEIAAADARTRTRSSRRAPWAGARLRHPALMAPSWPSNHGEARSDVFWHALVHAERVGRLRPGLTRCAPVDRFADAETTAAASGR
jgi:hypothetical protein